MWFGLDSLFLSLFNSIIILVVQVQVQNELCKNELFRAMPLRNQLLPSNTNMISSTKRAIKAISLLILLSHSIKFFNVKWHTNKTRRVLYRFHLSNLNSNFDSSLTSLISANFVSLTDCYELGWIWQRKGEMWEEWRLKARRSSDYEVDVFPHCLIGDC
ncbi:hypothetical protein YC2023_099364 [Brassica napus]